MTTTNETIRRVLAQHGRLNSDAQSLDAASSLYGAGLTSHASVNVMLAIEDELDIEFPEHLLRRSTFESIDSLSMAIESIADENVA